MSRGKNHQYFESAANAETTRFRNATTSATSLHTCSLRELFGAAYSLPACTAYLLMISLPHESAEPAYHTELNLRSALVMVRTLQLGTLRSTTGVSGMSVVKEGPAPKHCSYYQLISR